VIDQFEEFVLTTKPEQQRAFTAFIAALRSGPAMQNLRLLLVLRSEYEALLEDVGLPLPRSDQNLFLLARFQISDAAEFMKNSPLKLPAASFDRLLNSMAEMDETPGLVRPITLNVIGFVLSGRTSAPSLDAGIIVRSYIEETVNQQGPRYFAPKLLEQMITEQGTKIPCSEQALVKKAKLRQGEVRAVLNSLNIAALARPIDAEGAVWELSHDFIARAVARFLGRMHVEAFEQAGVCAAPVLLAISLIGGLWMAQPYLLDRINWYLVARPYVESKVRPFVLSSERERTLAAGSIFRECEESCPEMVVLPAGPFLMGSRGNEEHHKKNEEPQHPVSISAPFAMSKFDVTFADWDACAAVGRCPKAIDSGFGRGTRPVINVTWDQAQQYVKWLSLATGRTYRLPTEAEWEYASRGGQQKAYPWGDHFVAGKANCHGCNSQWDDKSTSPAGSFVANAFGLFDMSGNVWQWTEDCYHETYLGAPSDGSAWTSTDCERRVNRGGGWHDGSTATLRSANRDFDTHDATSYDVGVRIVRALVR
jgi:formylglycine-generating enzyme required for sulfatase activity